MTHTRWNGGRWHPGNEKWRGDERLWSGKGECVHGRGWVTVDVEVDTQCSGLVEDVTDLRFEVEVKGEESVAEAELVLVVLCMQNSGCCKKRMISSSCWKVFCFYSGFQPLRRCNIKKLRLHVLALLSKPEKKLRLSQAHVKKVVKKLRFEFSPESGFLQS